ncbi:hypothetical protein AWW68_18895 [Roseivirga spongicola]|uniref:DUF3127 domain-containing protein n=1 Tax=Roseivirga spongicola TaxID=333140 RepID=A0A150XE17_9BACT|nr:DUF3127 domain-containing protein [Roseivirga spongicola]KYG76926.1 hypothetical protein AWW68_18895 [Roseivirga spongicola]
MEVTGRVERIYDTQNVTSSFKKREFVLEYADNPQYPEFIKMEFVQDKCGLLDDVKEGQEVTVGINLRGRKYEKDGETRFFNTINAWKIDKGESTQRDTDIQNFEERKAPVSTGEDSDDLPF